MKKIKAFFNSLLLLIIVGLVTPTLASNNDEIVVPVELSEQGMPVASIQIQGHKIPLIFDNGASRTTITLNKELVKKLNLKMIATNKKNCFHDGTGKKTCLKVYTVPEIKIGHMTMHNVPCQLMDKLWGGNYDDGFILIEAFKNGVIGIDLFRQFNVLVDYKNSQAILVKLGKYPRQYDVKNWIQIPFDKKGIINTKINGTDAKIVFDTGSNNSVMKSTAKISVPQAEKKSCASINDKSCSYYFETTTFQVGNKQLPKTKFFVQKSAGENKIPFDALIGSSFIKEHPVFFDFKNNLIFIN